MPTTFESALPGASLPPNNGGNPPSNLQPESNDGHPLLEAIWQWHGRVYQIAALDRQTGRFINIAVNGAADATRRVVNLSGAGSDAYFACAGFRTAHSRQAANAAGASVLWLDLDCGEGKAADGKGYATVDEAEQQLVAFCRKVGLPEPTHIVYTGGGLHAYWALDGFLDSAYWKRIASMLKFLTNAHGLLADDTRTADIASVLRVPGTLNYKYNPPRPVLLKKAAPTPIPSLSMIDAIRRAYEHAFRSAAPQPPCDVVRDPVVYGPPDLAKLASALAVLDPDCDEWTWKFKRIAPIAREARNYPELGEALYKLARSWSSGELRGVKAKAWFTRGGNGRTGEEEFEKVWARFLAPQTYTGKPVTLGTIYHEAKAAGWDWSRAFPIAQDDAGVRG